MEKLAALVDALTFTRSRNAKLELIATYLRATPDPDRGWALAALTGGLSFDAVKAGTVRALIADRVDPERLRRRYRRNRQPAVARAARAGRASPQRH